MARRLPLDQAERRAPPSVRDELRRLRARLAALEAELRGERQRFIRQAAPTLMAGAMASPSRWTMGDKPVTTTEQYAKLAAIQARALAEKVGL